MRLEYHRSIGVARSCVAGCIIKMSLEIETGIGVSAESVSITDGKGYKGRKRWRLLSGLGEDVFVVVVFRVLGTHEC